MRVFGIEELTKFSYEAERKMITRILMMGGSFASLCGLVIMIGRQGKGMTGVHGGVLGIAICVFMLALMQEFCNWRKNRVLTFRKDSAIKQYMYKWISQGGRAVIFSRNLSWVNDEKMTSLLISKAENKELTICLPERISLVEGLETAGAEICVYPELEYIPEASFTIIRQGRMDARVAVGRRIKRKHVIEEFGLGEHPVYHVANDLTRVIIQFSRLRGKNEADGR